jgi:hypothetical protein
MRLARFNDGKYGIVVSDVIHDITAPPTNCRRSE